MPGPRRAPPWTAGGALLTYEAFFSLLLLATNDLWLKRHHPSWLSGKASDVALSALLPLFVAALIEWALVAIGRHHALASPTTRRRIAWISWGIATTYFVAVKTMPFATTLHIEMLGALAPGRHFRAVTDPTDLICLPASAVALRALLGAPSRSWSAESISDRPVLVARGERPSSASSR